ncbi:hypothetical protein PV409_36550 [Streptomyces sp. ME02-6979.5a]|uniref:hypothetical protein n=1 Tax=Streptomyces sp. ME02-6979.5a TaxID=462925 RepID=UPI0029AB61DD|nr:hypothetical protein [Streptomyces sp. ME02-6979.5a]MDX3343473.1 hypothetical protein [Streptomyces sp. ME02-6979.5a]
MTAQGENILAYLERAIGEAEQFGLLLRTNADRKLLELHGGRGHACPSYDYDGDLDEFARFYNHEICPVVRHLAEGYGWTEGER